MANPVPLKDVLKLSTEPVDNHVEKP